MNDPNHARLKSELETELLRALGPGPASSALADFAAQVGEDVAADELPDLSPADLAANLADFWRFAAKRRGLSPAIRVARAVTAGGGDADYDRLEVVQPD
ncbi:hypothetical protein, partial [Phenylobacterium sp.]|uniref:hypothetical protein n=1 Tax=Phenylobacterium sp. TaxID=1871053 RepID=UPI0019A36BA8